MDPATREYHQRLAADDRNSFRYRRDRDRYRRTPGIRTKDPTTGEIHTLQKRPIIGQPTNDKTKKFELIQGREINVSKHVLEEIARQAITPYKATHVGNFTRDRALSIHDYITYRRGQDFIIAIDNRHNHGTTDLNMSDRDLGGMRKLNGMVDAILSRHPNAAIMTTGASVGANIINSHPTGLMKNATAKNVKWASNR